MLYTGPMHCHKPFALIVEDFDSEGNVLSSIPAVFFGRVTEPTGKGVIGFQHYKSTIFMKKPKTNFVQNFRKNAVL